MNRVLAFLVTHRDKIVEHGRRLVEHVLGDMSPRERREFIFDMVTAIIVTIVAGGAFAYLLLNTGPPA